MRRHGIRPTPANFFYHPGLLSSVSTSSVFAPMFRFIHKYGFTLGFRIWRLKRRLRRRPQDLQLVAYNLNRSAIKLERRKKPAAAAIIRSILADLRS
jgi:hypothetical protein